MKAGNCDFIQSKGTGNSKGCDYKERRQPSHKIMYCTTCPRDYVQRNICFSSKKKQLHGHGLLQ